MLWRDRSSDEVQGSQLIPSQCNPLKITLPTPPLAAAIPFLILRYRNDNVSQFEKESSISLLLKYKECLTSRRGRCKVFFYWCILTNFDPIVGQARPVFRHPPCHKRANSKDTERRYYKNLRLPFINFMTVVLRDVLSPRLCADARNINSATLPYREWAPPL